MKRIRFIIRAGNLSMKRTQRSDARELGSSEAREWADRKTDRWNWQRVIISLLISIAYVNGYEFLFVWSNFINIINNNKLIITLGHDDDSQWH